MKLRYMISLISQKAFFIIALFFLFLGLYIVYHYWKKRKEVILQSSQHPRKIIHLILASYLATLVLVTLLERGSYGSSPINLKLFASYTEAWYRVDANAIMYIILNILMTIPLGVLLPLSFEKLKKPLSFILYCTLIILSIEFTQLITNRGVFDIDDIFNNFLGAWIGFAFIKSFLLLRSKSEKLTTIIAYQAPLILTLIFFVSTVSIYNSKPYGNLEFYALPKYKMKSVNITESPDLNLDLEAVSPNIYRHLVDDKIDPEELFELITGVDATTTLHSGHNLNIQNSEIGAGSLDFDIQTGQYIYTAPYVEVSEVHDLKFSLSEVIDQLEAININLPENTNHTLESDETHYTYSFHNRIEHNSGVTEIIFIELIFNSDNTLSRFHNNSIQLVADSKVKVKSPKAVIEDFKNGRIGIELYDLPSQINILDITSTTMMDSKGFHRPAYEITYETENQTLVVSLPA